jgi:hypothetical protein
MALFWGNFYTEDLSGLWSDIAGKSSSPKRAKNSQTKEKKASKEQTAGNRRKQAGKKATQLKR